MFLFVPVASDLVIGHHWKEPDSVLLALFLWVFIQSGKIPPQLSLPQAEEPLLIEKLLTSPNHLCGPSLNCLFSTFICLVYSRALDWIHYFKYSFTSAEEKGIITSSDLLAIFLTQSRKQ